jgi:hypothetical protein
MPAKMKTKLLSCLFLAPGSIAALAELSCISVDGNHFVDNDGKVVVFSRLDTSGS